MPRPAFAFLLLTLFLVAALAPSHTTIAQDPAPDFRALKKEYEEADKNGQRTAQGRAIEKMAVCNEKDAAKFLLGELDKDQKARKSKKAGLPGDIRDKIINALSKFTDEESVGLIGKAALDLNSAKEPILALDQFDFFKSLARMEGVAAADKTLRDALADAKNPYIKCAALEAIRQAGAKRFLDDVCAILREENPEWATKWLIVPINTLACLEDIVEKEETESAIKVVEAVIVWESRKTCLDERVRFFGGKMLHKITGEIADMGSVFFWEWWVKQMKFSGKVDNSSKPNEKRSKTVATPPVFDTAPVGRRFVFVIDVSDSMTLPLKITLEEIEKRKKERGPVSGKRKGEGDAPAEEEDVEDDNPLRKLPWKDIKTKIELAREELSRAVKSFEGDREFAIVTYSTEVRCITDGFVPATAANCAKWSREAKELETEHLTNIHGSLMRALKINKKGIDCDNPSVDPDAVLTGADSIIFLTDGWGSWDDQSVGKTKDKRNGQDNTVGDGPFIYGEDIWPDILRHNLFRKVIINTVGIGNHDKELMKTLAGRTGGVYVDWSFPE